MCKYIEDILDEIDFDFNDFYEKENEFLEKLKLLDDFLISEEKEKLDKFINEHSYNNIRSCKASEIVRFENLSYIAFNLINEFKNKKHYLKYSDVIAFGIKFSSFSGNSKLSKFNRLMNFDYLKSKLKTIRSIYIECYNLNLTKKSYVTDELLFFTKKKLEKEKEFLDNRFLKNNFGSVFSLSDLTRSSEAKASELYAFNKQLEEKADALGYTWIFATITCPPKFHINPQNGSNSWDRESTPKDSVIFLNKIWSNFRKKMNKLEINFFGFWSKEPHASSSVHKHILVYVNKNNVSTVCRCISHYTKVAFEFFSPKVFIPKVSCFFEIEKESEKLSEKGVKKAKPSSYIFKYIKKSLFDDCSDLNNDKIKAHYKKYKYRRFGFFGIDRCISLWRELKRFNKLGLKTDSEALNSLLEQVKNNNFKDFCVNPLKNVISYFYKDAIYDDSFNLLELPVDKYGDFKKQVRGIISQGVIYKTRFEYTLFVGSQ